MQSFVIVGTYLALIAALYHFRNKITGAELLRNWKLVPWLVLAAGIGILSAKAYFIYKAGAVIPPELISPAYLSPEGESLKKKLLAESSQEAMRTAKSIAADAWAGSYFGRGEAEKTPARLEPEVERYAANDFTLRSDTAYRGRFIHHYSTILFPYREVFSGKKYSALFSSQYGAIAILPLALMRNTDYTAYALLSLPLLLAFFAVVWQVLKRMDSSWRAPICAILLAVIAVNSYQLALRFSPGFAFYRYLPAFFSISVLILAQYRRTSGAGLALLAAAAVLNSLQFNLLFILAGGAFFVLKWLDKKEFPRAEAFILLIVGLVCGVQVLLYQWDHNLLKVPVFSSVGGGRLVRKQALLTFLLPLTLLGIKFVRNGRRLALTGAELAAYIAYGFFSLYTISFSGSPQHYVGFVLCVLSPLAVMLNGVFAAERRESGSADEAGLFLFVFLVFLASPSLLMKFPTLPRPEAALRQEIYEYKPVGATLRFSTPNRLDQLRADFDGLLRKNGLTATEVYFFSKDKIYLELVSGRNYLPENYDPFLNFPLKNTSAVFSQAAKDGIKYLVLDSPANIQMTRGYLEAFSRSLPPGANGEPESYLSLLGGISDLAGSQALSRRDCSWRWCLYKIQ